MTLFSLPIFNGICNDRTLREKNLTRDSVWSDIPPGPHWEGKFDGIKSQTRPTCTFKSWRWSLHSVLSNFWAKVLVDWRENGLNWAKVLVDGAENGQSRVSTFLIVDILGQPSIRFPHIQAFHTDFLELRWRAPIQNLSYVITTRFWQWF